MNAVAAIETGLEPRELLDRLMAIEQEFGRERLADFANGPRTLDLDILLFGELEISSPELVVPHPRLAERAFALTPLNEIAPRAFVPGWGRTVAELLDRLLETTARDESDAVVRVESSVWENWEKGSL
jgi:2-amino-4-hydroxy-6-hydroxymethyldihydropteridine diphosphokinase